MPLHDRRPTPLPCLLALLLVLFSLAACERREKPASIVSLAKREPLTESAKPSSPVPPLHIAIAAVISPKETYALYKELVDYIALKQGRQVKLIQRETYQEVNDLLQLNEIDLAFVCSGAYVDGHDGFGLELLVAPEANGKTVYYSYIIVPATSPVQSLEGLRGKRFAFTDPMSNTGRKVPVFLLARMGESPESFFSESVFTNSHDRSIRMVADNLVDGAAIDGLILDYVRVKTPELAARVRIIQQSEPFGIPPVVVPANLDPALKASLRNIFLTLHNDEQGKKILAKVMIDRFVPIDDQAYNSIRAMNQGETGK